MPDKILLLGGTKEAAAMAQELVEAGHEVISSLAGRTKEPKPLAGKCRIGGFGGADGLAQWIKDNQITRLIDATHPFAKTISANANAAAQMTGVRLDTHTRPPWQPQVGDRWTIVRSLEEAVDRVTPNTTVLLALGAQHIAPFARRFDVRFIIRMVDPPEKHLLFSNYKLVLGRPSADWKEEAKLLQDNGVAQIICRNSGGTGAYAKIEAARNLGLEVLMIERTPS